MTTNDTAQRSVHIAEFPVQEPDRDSGIQQDRARQRASDDVHSGAYRSEQVMAGEVLLDFEIQELAQWRLADSQTRISGHARRLTGESFINDAESGRFTERTPQTLTKSLAGARAELAAATTARVKAVASAEEKYEVLEGRRLDVTGTPRPGHQLAPYATSFSKPIFWGTLTPWIPLIAAFLIEGTVVTFNMYAFFRSPSWLEPIAIALIALFALTLTPALVGKSLAGVAARRKARLGDILTLALGIPVWIIAGVSLARVRVRIIQEEAVAKIQAAQDSSIQAAVDAGTPVPEFGPIDPNTVFDPTLLIAFWTVVVLGIGAAVLIWELLHDNPARLDELRARAAARKTIDHEVLLTERVDEITRQIALQEKARDTNGLAHEEELQSNSARYERNILVYGNALITESGDPEMLGAYEERWRTVHGTPAEVR